MTRKSLLKLGRTDKARSKIDKKERLKIGRIPDDKLQSMLVDKGTVHHYLSRSGSIYIHGMR